MTITIVSDIKQIDRQSWSDFIKNHPKGSVFQSPEMYDCYSQTPNIQTLILAAYVGTQIRGLLIATILQEQGVLKSVFSTRSIIPSGPIIFNDDPRVLKKLLDEYNRIIPRSVIYSQIRNQFDWLPCCDTFREAGFRFSSHLNYLIQLDSIESMWSRIGQGRRQQIKKAQRNGLITEVYSGESLTEDLIKKGYSIIREVYTEAKLPLVDFAEFNAARKSGLLVLIVILTPNQEIAGCRFALRYEKVLYGWYAGSYNKYYHLFPNDLLIWDTLKWALDQGFDTFDYGGAGSPNEAYGVRLFKAQLGGRLVNYGRFEIIHHPIKMRIAKWGFQLYRLFFKFR